MKERKKKRIRVREKMKILEEKQKTKIYLKYVYRGDKKINKMKRKIQKFMRNWKEGFLKNVHLHISKQ